MESIWIEWWLKKSHHIDHKNIPDATREDNDAEHDGDHVLGQYFNEQFFFFCEAHVSSHS